MLHGLLPNESASGGGMKGTGRNNRDMLGRSDTASLQEALVLLRQNLGPPTARKTAVPVALGADDRWCRRWHRSLRVSRCYKEGNVKKEDAGQTLQHEASGFGGVVGRVLYAAIRRLGKGR